jgi:hypothetical protein
MKEWPELDELKAVHGEALQVITLDVTSQQSVDEAAAYIREQADHLGYPH